MQLGAEAVFVGSGIFKSSDPAARANAIVQAAKNFNNPEKLLEASRALGDAMPGLDIAKMPGIRAAANARLVMKKVGVLSLQGDFAAHGAALEARRRRAGLRARAGTVRRDRRPGDSRRRKHHHAQAAAL